MFPFITSNEQNHWKVLAAIVSTTLESNYLYGFNTAAEIKLISESRNGNALAKNDTKYIKEAFGENNSCL